MLKLISLKSGIATLQFQVNHTLTLLDWNQTTRKNSPFRYMIFSVPPVFARSWLYLEGLLKERPNASIIHILSHDKRMGFQPVVNELGELYIDDFGLPVYMASEVDWHGGMTDIDERFEGTGKLPFD